MKTHLKAKWMAMLALAAVALCACSSGDATGSSGSQGATGSVDTATAEQLVAEYSGQPSAFPVDQPLAQRPTGSSIGYLQCSTPICGLVGETLQQAADAMGTKLEVVKAGTSVVDLQNAMSTLISLNPAAVVIAGVEPAQISNQLQTLQDANIPVIGQGIMYAEKYGIDANMSNEQTMQLAGQLLAAYAVKTKGADSNVAFYTTPELSFSPIIADAFAEEYKKLCPSCEMRTESIPLATVGNTAPQKVVADLEAHPDTNQAVFAVLDATNGLPAALSTAGMSDRVDVFGYGASPVNLQDIQSGGLKMGIALDSNVNSWTLIDAAARLIGGQALTSGEESGLPPMQIIEQTDIANADLQTGFVAYPDYVERFTNLWGSQ